METCSTQFGSVVKNKRTALINLFIAAYSLGTFILCCPPSVCRDVLVKAIKPYFNFLGLYQYFWMYAPNPPKVYTIRIYADLKLKDGTHKTWEFPRLLDYKNDFYKHQSKHRYYQWKYYLFEPKANPEILKDAALFAARINLDPANPPINVLLYKDTVETVCPYYRDNGVLRTRVMGRDEFFYCKIKAEEL